MHDVLSFCLQDSEKIVAFADAYVSRRPGTQTVVVCGSRLGDQVSKSEKLHGMISHF